MIVRFLKQYGIYAAGDIAPVTDSAAELLVAHGIAELHQEQRTATEKHPGVRTADIKHPEG
jgi:hypothetical protein